MLLVLVVLLVVLLVLVLVLLVLVLVLVLLLLLVLLVLVLLLLLLLLLLLRCYSRCLPMPLTPGSLPPSLATLLQHMAARPECAAAAARQRVQSAAQQLGCAGAEHPLQLRWWLRALQMWDFETLETSVKSAYDSAGWVPVLPGPVRADPAGAAAVVAIIAATALTATCRARSTAPALSREVRCSGTFR